MKRYRKKYLNKRRRRRHTLVVMAEYFVLVIIACVLYLCYTAYESNQNDSLYNNKSIISKKNFSDGSSQNEYSSKYVSAKEKNPEVIGWISIDDTDISYPLLQTNDNNYYLTHNYKKEVSNYGSIYLHKNSVLSSEFSNLIVYGHNINSGSQMFSTLMNYKNKDFYQNHKTIRITTDSKEYIYTIFAVMKSKVYDNNEDVFKYYSYTDLTDKEKFNEYVSNCKKYQLYNTNVSAVYGNQIISLVTCEYSQDNGRLIVLGKKTKNLVVNTK